MVHLPQTSILLDPELQGFVFFRTQNGPFVQTKIFPKKKLLINIAPIIHAYLHSKNSKVRYQSTNEIMTIKEY